VTRAEVIRLVAVALCFGAGGAGGTWYLVKMTPPTSAPVTATAITPHSVRTVSWFKAHQAEMMQKRAACDDNPGSARTDPECANADNAFLDRMMAGPPK
jgi:hypothetical protein